MLVIAIAAVFDRLSPEDQVRAIATIQTAHKHATQVQDAYNKRMHELVREQHTRNITAVLEARDELTRIRTLSEVSRSGPKSTLAADRALYREAMKACDGREAEARDYFHERMNPPVERDTSSRRFTKAKKAEELRSKSTE